MKKVLEKVFRRQNLTPIGALMILIGISCDLDRSFVPAVVAVLVTGCALCIIGTGIEYEECEDQEDQEETEERRTA